jgi:hypothetical protein
VLNSMSVPWYRTLYIPKVTLEGNLNCRRGSRETITFRSIFNRAIIMDPNFEGR